MKKLNVTLKTLSNELIEVEAEKITRSAKYNDKICIALAEGLSGADSSDISSVILGAVKIGAIYERDERYNTFSLTVYPDQIIGIEPNE